jgi:hypothetical protein
MRSTPANPRFAPVLGLVVAITLVGVAGCGSGAGTLATAGRFNATVQAAGAAGGTIAMASVAHVSWDRGVFGCPSDSVEDLTAAVRARWARPPATLGTAAYVLFARSGAVVDVIRLDRSAIDPCAGGAPLPTRTFGPSSDFAVRRGAAGGWVLDRVD